jgi:phage recombination protein Bet
MTNIQKATAVEEVQLTNYLTALGLGKSLTANEQSQFIQIAKAFNLNPFKREIYAIKYGTTFNIIVGYESYIKRAESTGLLDGWKVETKGKLGDPDFRAIATIHRKDFKEPFVHEVYFVEYDQKNAIWKSKPITMIKKVAISQSFRLAFNMELGGMPYTAEEIVTEEQGYATFTEVDNAPADLQIGIDEVNSCETEAELKAAWSKYKHLQKHVEFIAAKEEAKARFVKEVTHE